MGKPNSANLLVMHVCCGTAALGAENALQGGDLDLPRSEGDTSGGPEGSTAAAVAEGSQGGDLECIEVPDEVEDILGASPSAYCMFLSLCFWLRAPIKNMLQE